MSSLFDPVLDVNVPDVPFTSFGVRTWPKNIFDITQWGYYILYLAIVFFSPIIAGLLFSILMCVGYALAYFFEAPYGRLKNICCLGAFSVLYAMMLLFTLIASGFCVYVFISYLSIKFYALDLVKGVLGLPKASQQSLQELSMIVTDIHEDIDEIIEGLDVLNDPIDSLGTVINQTDDYMETQEKFDILNGRLDRIEDSAENLNDLGFPNTVDFSGYEFPNSTEIVSPEVDETMGELREVIAGGKAGVTLTQVSLRVSLNAFTQLINSTIFTLTEFLTGGLQKAVDGMDSVGINDAGVDQYSMWSLIGESSILLVCLIFYTLFVLAFSCGLLCMCKSGECLYILTCCSCLGMIIHFLLGGIILIFFFTTDDFCKQGEYTIGRAEEYLPASVYSVMNFEIDAIGGGKIGVNLINITRNVLYCGQPEAPDVISFLDAIGLTLSQINFTSQIIPYESIFMDSIESFDILGLLDNARNLSQSLTNMTSLLPTDVDENFDNLEKKLNESFGAEDFNQFMLYQVGYNEKNESDKYVDLNDLLTTCCSGIKYYVTRENISDFHTTIDPWITDCSPLSIANNNSLTFLQFELETYKQIFESDTYKYAVGNYTIIQTEMAILKKNATEVDNVIDTILSIPQTTSNNVEEVDAAFATIVSNITDLVPQVLDNVDQRVRNCEVLHCSRIGAFYKSLKISGCGQIITAFGFIGFSTVFLGIVYFLMFWSLLYTGSMLRDYRKNFDYDEDDESFSDDYSDVSVGGGGGYSEDSGGSYDEVSSDDNSFSDGGKGGYSDESDRSYSDDGSFSGDDDYY